MPALTPAPATPTAASAAAAKRDARQQAARRNGLQKTTLLSAGPTAPGRGSASLLGG